jgi:hypothetical protein
VEDVVGVRPGETSPLLRRGLGLKH